MNDKNDKFVYDRTKDVVKYEVIVDCGKTKYGIKVYSYDGGQEKVCLHPFYEDKHGVQRPSRLADMTYDMGRIPLADFEKIHSALANRFLEDRII